MAPPEALEQVMDKRVGEGYCTATDKHVHGGGCCNYETVDAIGEYIFPRVQELVRMPFFHFYKVVSPLSCIPSIFYTLILD